ncbi:T9SS type A sorting domain-containing protein [uncultured Aquimarina sp.]|uniref:T9SS type A sorting domain-containing protein n=1 Tax=uncultured Aquimarina sp. TaxID=575652 RepID=UPI00262B2F55|nr:T9SS type A sorting domain-containing protein [uncultured Aquimarina sp.]
MKKLLLSLATILITVYGSYAQCGPGEDTTAPVFVGAGDGTLANPFVNLLASTVGSVPSGTYYFNFNGSTFQGALDNDTDGGGWLMVLNYVHLAGDNSVLQVRNTDLPLLGSSTLGDNEAATANWGHMGNQLAAAIDFEEMRFYGETTGHTRIIDFRTSYTNAISYVKTGNGSFSGINNVTNFTALTNHTANIPANAPNTFSSQGDLALTEFPFWRGGQFHWGIRGLGNRWEVDDQANNTQSTIHRMWVRGDLSPAGTTSISRNLDTSGNLTITPADFGLGFTDNCVNVNQSLSQTDFTCADIGTNAIQVIATDDEGNSTPVDVTVIIEDAAPVITSDNSITLNIDSMNPTASVTLAALNASAADDCGLQSFEITGQADFSCADITTGPPNIVTLTAIDNMGQTTTTQVSVFVNDAENPTGQCVAPFTVELNATGNTTITDVDVITNVMDNCSINSINLSQSNFTCADIGDNIITVTVTDLSGNIFSCNTTVTIAAPSCPGNQTLEVDADACGAVYNYPCASNITAGPASGTLLAEGTTTTFTYDIPDGIGGTTSCNYTVTVEDTQGPTFTAQDQTLALDVSGMASLTANDLLGPDPFASDYTVDMTGSLDRVDISMTGTEVVLNDDEVTSALPIGFTFAFYGNLYTEFYISSNGFLTFTANSSDGCCNGQSLPDATVNEPSNLIAFDWNDINPEDGGTMRYETIGTAPNRILIMDWDSVTHIDDVNDITTTQVKLFENTNRIEIHTTNIPQTTDDKTQGLENMDGTAAVIVPGRNAAQWGATNDVVAFNPVRIVTDGCGVDTLVASQTDFDCTNLGANIVTLTATDLNGNVSMQNATVTITTTDTTAPVITLTGDNPQEIVQGTAYSELGATADDGSMVVIDASSVDTNTVGTYSVTYNATDVSCNDAIEVIRTVNVVPLLAIEDNLFSKAITVYPNPTSSTLYIESSENPMDTIEVMDMSGRVIKRIEQDAVSRYQLNTSHLAGGIYFVKITSGNKEAIKRITKN